MLQATQRLRLVLETAQHFPGRVSGANHLQRDDAMGRFLLRLEDRAHPAFAQQPQDAIPPDRGRQRLPVARGRVGDVRLCQVHNFSRNGGQLLAGRREGRAFRFEHAFSSVGQEEARAAQVCAEDKVFRGSPSTGNAPHGEKQARHGIRLVKGSGQ